MLKKENAHRPPHNITDANCPTTRTIAVDARDNHTYWVQKLGEQYWMLTNLAYSGGTSNGDFTNIKDAINSGLTNTDAGPLANWLAQRGGYWSNVFSYQGSAAHYWSGTQSSAIHSIDLLFSSSNVNTQYSGNKSSGFFVRCVTI